MKNESYRTIARHLAESKAVTVSFEPGACPSTDGRNITLPTELTESGALQLLGALLHETAHIKHSGDPAEIRADLSDAEGAACNCLEDIRIEHLTEKKYSKAPEFIKALIDGSMTRSLEQLRKEPGAVQVLKGLYIQHNGYNPAEVYTADHVLKAIADFTHYIDEAKACNDIHEVKALAKKLTLELIGKQPAIPKGQPGGTPANIPGDFGIRNSEKFYDGDGFTPTAEQQAAAETEAAKAEAEAAKHGANKDKAQTALDEKRAEYKKLDRSIAGQYGAATRYGNEADQAESQGCKAEAEALRAKAAGKNALAQQLESARQKVNSEYSQLHEVLRKHTQKEYDEKQKAESALKDAENFVRYIRGFSKGIDLAGFGAIDHSTIIPADNIQGDNSVPLAEVIQDALLFKAQESKADDSGARLNNDKLSCIYTDPDQLFLKRQQCDFNTKVAFIVDASGSMGTLTPNDMSRESSINMAVGALLHLTDAFKEAIDNGAPGDFSVYLFGTRVIKVIGSAAEYNRKATLNKINMLRNTAGDNTNLLTAANQVSAEIKAEADNRRIVIITDAQVDNGDLQGIANGISTDSKVIYVSVNRRLEESSRLCNEIFQDYNITNHAGAKKILSRALLASI